MIFYEISRGDSHDEYILSGVASFVGSSTWTRAKGKIELLLGKKTVKEVITIPIRFSSTDKSRAFSRTFTTEHEFDAVLMGYAVDMRG